MERIIPRASYLTIHTTWLCFKKWGSSKAEFTMIVLKLNEIINEND